MEDKNIIYPNFSEKWRWANNLIKNIYRKEEKNNNHTRIVFFNFIKITKLKKVYEDRIKELEKTFDYYRKNNLDIKTVPPATGILRDIQKIQIKFLDEIDYVCKQAGFDYWIDFGTLLGAIRNNNFIPWDDDIDVSMPREFYDKFVDTFNSLTRDKNIKALYYRRADFVSNYIIKIKMDNIPIVLDIFPYDFYGKKLTQEQRKEQSTYIKEERIKRIKNKIKKEKIDDKELERLIKEFRKEILPQEEYKKESKTDLIYGVDFMHYHPIWIFDFETIYPLKKIKFEGKEYNCPNKETEYIKLVYGEDYMNYPKEKIHLHNAMREIKHELLEEIEKLGK